ncbi:MAG: BrnT family toxin [Bryobacteraceae bacterium]
MSFEWDPNKAAANVRKHAVQFSEALGVFSDDYAITINDDESDPDEQRFVSLGMGIKGRVLVVVYCYSGENIRIISARIAGRPEREQYEAQR